MKKLNENKILMALAIFVSIFSLNVAMAMTGMPVEGVRATIPFAFNAGEAHFSAGDYKIVQSSNIDPTMEIIDKDKETGALLLVDSMYQPETPQKAELVFCRINGKDFLKEVRTESTTYEFDLSKQEKPLAMHGSKLHTHKIACKMMKP